MSHIGNRSNRNITARMVNEVLNNPRPKKIPYNPISEENLIQKGGRLDGQELEGEFRGNGDTVLKGLKDS